MAWKESDIVSQRVEFVGRLLRGERMTDLCTEFGISRKTGYKLMSRYLEYGSSGFDDQSRRPHRSPYETPEDIVELIIDWRGNHPTWGPKKLKVEIAKKHPGVKVPAISTIGEILSRKDMVRRRKRRRRATPSATTLCQATAPNQVWCSDFKGQFRLGNRRYCYPLTVSDHFSRFVLCCEGLEDTTENGVRPAYEAMFTEYGVPDAMRSDNGTPFASTGLGGLTSLSVWWMRLGIRLERIQPGHPEQNGRHERMHLTLKEDTTRPAKQNILQQQERFDEFRAEFNEARPHEALEMKYPADVYEPSTRPYEPELAPLEYPLHDEVRRVYPNGNVSVPGLGKIYVSTALRNEHVGLRELTPGNWLVTFMDLDLGEVEAETKRLRAC
jgi:transposase InsO family protein